MLPALKYPEVNGVRTDHSSISVSLNAREYAIKEIHWDGALEPQAVFANDPAAIAWTRGQYKPELGFELWLAESEQFETDLMADPNYTGLNGEHLGVKECMFPVMIFFQPERSMPRGLVVTCMARIAKNPLSSSVGGEHHFRKYECTAVTPISENGRKAFSGQKVI